MSIRLPQWINAAPMGPDARSVAGSTLKPAEKPVAAEYIALAANSRANAATALEIANRLEIE